MSRAWPTLQGLWVASLFARWFFPLWVSAPELSGGDPHVLLLKFATPPPQGAAPGLCRYPYLSLLGFPEAKSS